MTRPQSSTWPPTMSSLQPILQWVRRCLAGFAVDPKIIQQLILISEEVVVNSINYSKASPQSLLCLVLDHSDETISLEFTDHGEPFNPLQQSDPDITLPIMQREDGGLGILLIKQIADRVEYRRDNGQNILTVWKHF